MPRKLHRPANQTPQVGMDILSEEFRPHSKTSLRVESPGEKEAWQSSATLAMYCSSRSGGHRHDVKQGKTGSKKQQEASFEIKNKPGILLNVGPNLQQVQTRLVVYSRI